MNVDVEDVFASWLGASMLLLVYGGIVWMLVDVARRPDWQFTVTGRSRGKWIAVGAVSFVCCSFVGFILSIVYLVSVRPQLERARPPAPPAAPWGRPPPPDAPPRRWEVEGGRGDDRPPPPPPPPLG
jgi:hypothetical protein